MLSKEKDGLEMLNCLWIFRLELFLIVKTKQKNPAWIPKSWRFDYLFGMFPSTSEQAGRLDTVVSDLLFMTIDLAEAIPEKRWENINLSGIKWTCKEKWSWYYSKSSVKCLVYKACVQHRLFFRPIFGKYTKRICRNLEFFAWVFESSQKDLQ